MTMVPPGTSIIARVEEWTLGGVNLKEPANRYILRNGVGVNGASGTAISICNGVVMVKGRNGNVYTYSGQWADTGLKTMQCATP